MENLAKDEYVKWSQVDKLLAGLNARLGKTSSKEVTDMFKRIEELALDSKQKLKKNFKVSDSKQSLVSLDKNPTVKSIVDDSILNAYASDSKKTSRTRCSAPTRAAPAFRTRPWFHQ